MQSPSSPARSLLLAVLVACAALTGCMPPPGDQPLTPREKRLAIEEYKERQRLREDVDAEGAGVCATATGVVGLQNRQSRGTSTEGFETEACPP